MSERKPKADKRKLADLLADLDKPVAPAGNRLVGGKKDLLPPDEDGVNPTKRIEIPAEAPAGTVDLKAKTVNHQDVSSLLAATDASAQGDSKAASAFALPPPPVAIPLMRPKPAPLPSPVEAVAPKPAAAPVVEPKAAKPAAPKSSSIPPVPAPKAGTDVVKLVEEMVAKKLEPLQKTIADLTQQLAMLTKVALGGIPEELMPAVLEGVENSGGLFVQLDSVQDRVTVVDEKVGAVDGKVKEVDAQAKRIDGKIGSLDSEVGALDGKVGTLGTEVAELGDRFDAVGKKADDAHTIASAVDQALSELSEAVTETVTGISNGVRNLGKMVLGGIPEEQTDAVLAAVEKNGGLMLQVDGMQDSITEAVGKADTAQQAADVATNAAEAAQSKADQSSSKADGLERSVAAIKTSVGDLSSDVAGAKTRLESLGRTETETRAKVESLKDIGRDVAGISTRVEGMDKSAAQVRKFVLHGIPADQTEAALAAVEKNSGLLVQLDGVQDNVRAMDARLETMEFFHDAIVRYEIVGALMPPKGQKPELKPIILTYGLENVQIALKNLKANPELLAHAVLTVSKVAEKNGLSAHEIANPGNNQIALKAAKEFADKIKEVSNYVDYCISNM